MKSYVAVVSICLSLCLLIACKGGSGVDQCTEGDCKNGAGKLVYADGASYYQGEFKNGKREGKGVFAGACKFIGSCAKGEEEITKCEGTWKDDLRDGAIKCSFKSGDSFEGNFSGGKKEGDGTYTWAKGDVVKGQWKSDKLDGKATMTWKSGGSYTGDYAEGVIEGKGEFTYPSGEKYVGDVKNWKQNGQGTKYYSNGKVHYKGEFKDGLPHGTGTLYDINGKVTFTGRFDKGIKVGTSKADEGDMSPDEVDKWEKAFSGSK